MLSGEKLCQWVPLRADPVISKQTLCLAAMVASWDRDKQTDKPLGAACKKGALLPSKGGLLSSFWGESFGSSVSSWQIISVPKSLTE